MVKHPKKNMEKKLHPLQASLPARPSARPPRWDLPKPCRCRGTRWAPRPWPPRRPPATWVPAAMTSLVTGVTQKSSQNVERYGKPSGKMMKTYEKSCTRFFSKAPIREDLCFFKDEMLSWCRFLEGNGSKHGLLLSIFIWIGLQNQVSKYVQVCTSQTH